MSRLFSLRTFVSAVALSCGLAGSLALWAQAPKQETAKPSAADKTASSAKSPVVLFPIVMMENFFSKSEVVQELGLTESQVESIKHRVQSGRLEFDRATRFTPGARPNNGPNFQESLTAIQNRTKEDVEKLLLPHQAARFRQLALRFKYTDAGSGVRVYLSDEFQAELGYTDKQRDEIQDELLRVERETREAVEKIIADGRARIQNRLTTEQRAKAEELAGPAFEFRKETPEEVRARIRRGLR